MRHKPALNLVQLHRIPIFEQLRWEEALLRADDQNWCLINVGSPPAIVMGISGQAEELVDLRLLQQQPIPLIRRFSGGGTVVVDEETLFVTFICKADDIPIQPFPHSILQWTERFYQPVFSPHPFELRENDYVIGDLKFGGNAQSICKGRWLHHSSFLWDYQVEWMRYLRIPKRMPAYRDGRSHADFLCCLKDHFPSKEVLRQQIFGQLASLFDLHEREAHELNPFLEKPHRKSLTHL